MDTPVLSGSTTGHAHVASRHHRRDVPVMVAASAAAGAAILGIAAVYTNSPAGRAAAAPVDESLISESTQTLADSAGVGLQPLRFRAELPEGPVVLGEAGRLVITVANDNVVPIRLDETSVEVSGTSDPGCLAEWFEFGGYAPRRGGVVVPPRATQTVSLSYTLRDLSATNQDACKGADVSLTISGRGHPV